MLTATNGIPLQTDGQIDLTQWLQNIAVQGHFQDLELIRSACTLSQLAGHDHAIETGESCFQHGLAMANVLIDLEVDQETVAAAIIYASMHYTDLTIEDVTEQLGEPIARLVSGVEKMHTISQIGHSSRYPQSKHQNDNMRKMLLAMVDDVRVVLIKLADRLCVLRSSAPISLPMRQKIANEVMTIYAPLANRLGIGAIKWEMEDLAFRYLQPDAYKAIAKELNTKRFDRDRYVNMIVDVLNQHLKDLNIEHFAVHGRSKHIHGIYRKMMRKCVPINQIYDATAVRILVDTKGQCYEVLDLVHNLWHQVLSEFDDYIAKPKANGYQSLHTAVEGPEGRVFEVQIRTFQMHDQAEMGVAAHWKYKEGGTGFKASHERKIEWLRQVLAWHHDIQAHHEESALLGAEFLDDRVYVFTPDGDILDLPRGVTALDFAYHLHTDLGHRCRGAKVNGAIVPLTYELKVGDVVEVLTGKEAKPSRDWINPHLNYLKSSRAKAKVLHWFKLQNYDKNRDEGRDILDKELKNLGIKTQKLQDLLPLAQARTLDDMYAAVGSGDIKLAQIVSKLTPDNKLSEVLPHITKNMTERCTPSPQLRIEGVGNLLTHMARCCQPLPGDDVIGYITLGRGVSIHRRNCSNVVHSHFKQQDRFLEVTWGEVSPELYRVDVIIKALERATLFKDVTSLLSAEKAHVLSLKTEVHPDEQRTMIYLSLKIDSLATLSRLLNRLEHIPNVLEARRVV